MGWASGFRAGTDMARGWIDTYNTANDQRRLREIGQAKPAETQNSYTSQDAEQLNALANARDAQGNPYYNLEGNADGSYGLKTNFTYQGQDGQQVQPGGVATTFAPRTSAMEFMGTRYAPEDLTPDRIDGLRARAMADVISERDPVRGLQMRQSIKAGERDDKRFGWEEQQQPLKQKQLEQSTRAGEIQLGQAERGLSVQGAEDAAMAMPEDEVRAQLTGYLNTNKSDLPLLVLGTNKGGFIMAERNPATGAIGEQFSVPLAVGRKLVVGRQLAEKGFGKEALQYLTGVDDNITSIIDRYNKNALDVARTNNDATYKSGSLANDRARVGIAAEGLRLRQQEAADRKTAGSLENDINGVLEGYQAAMAAGPQGAKAAAIYAQEYDQLRAIAGQRGLKVPPALSALAAAQRGSGAKPTKIEDAGVKYKMPDGSVGLTDGRGGYIAENGVLPDDRGAVLSKGGVKDNLTSQVQWSDDGRFIMFRGMEFDPRNPRDMAELNDYYARQGANDIAVGEYQQQLHGRQPETGFGPKITYTPDPRAPSIYAGPEEWAKYRATQGR